jgi:hypothetical protein
MEEPTRGVNGREPPANGPLFDVAATGMMKGASMTRPSRSRARRLGRRLGILALATIVSVPTAVWTYQIMKAVWAPPSGPAPESCASGLRGLLQALERARSAVHEAGAGEQKSLTAFRAALLPEWGARPAVEGVCRAEPRRLGILKEIDALRYAEEHAIRYEAGALAGQRWRARELERDLGRETAPGLATPLQNPEKP